MSRDSGGSTPHIPELDPEYELTRELGRGGTAVVYLARERELGRDVAIKLIRPGYTDDAEAVARLAREARVVARLRHPNLVTLFGTRRLDDGSVALIMQYVPGRTLKEMIREYGPLPIRLVERVLRDIGTALDYAHRQHGIVHRDIKPENIYIDDEYGSALLADFGIARGGDGDSSLTLVGTALGTPAYMSPEQIDGAELDGRSDLYSLGLVAHEMLTGLRPWAGYNLYSTIYKQKHEDLPSITRYRPDVPGYLQRAIEGLLPKDREARWSSAAEFVRHLRPAAALWTPTVVDDRAERPAEEAAHDPDYEDSQTVRYDRNDAGSGAPDEAAPATLGESRAHSPEESPRPVADSLVAPPDLVASVAADLATAVAPETKVATRTETRPARARREKATAPARKRRPTPQPAAPPRRRRVAIAVGVLVLAASAATLATMAVRETDVVEVTPPAPDPRPAIVEETPPPAAPALLSRPARVVPLTGENGVALAGEALPGSVGIRVEDDRGLALAGVRVVFRVAQGDGAVVPTTATTDANGIATAEWALGRVAGEQVLAIEIPDSDGVETTVRATAMARDPARIVAAGGQGQEFVAGESLPERVSVRIEDEYGNPVDGVRVEFRVPESSGSVNPAAATTTAAGIARTTWRLGPEAGEQELIAVVPGGRPLQTRFVARARYRLSPRSTIVAGAAHTCSILADGRVHCWGGNESGQLGVGDSGRRPQPVAVSGGVPFAAISAGGGHTCGLDVDGAAYCWGQNDSGQLGDGGRTPWRSPVRVRTERPFLAIAAGLAHTCAISEAGAAFCWGANANGQVGDATRLDRPAPVAVSGGQRFQTITVGWSHTCALNREGVAFCWGSNSSGQLGDGSAMDRVVPVPVGADLRFAALSAGATHTCGVGRDGAVYCWGRNHQGQLGDGTTADRNRPARVPGLDGAIAVTAGAVHSCALTRAGAAFCWGSNAFGQLGNGTDAGSNEPVAVAGNIRFAGIHASGSHTCGRSPGGDSYCWGYNVEGQVGDGGRTNRTRPVRIALPR